MSLGERIAQRLAASSGWAPAGLYSRIVAEASRLEVPSRLRRFAWSAFGRAVGADLSEPAEPLEAYPTLGDFFARRLRQGARPVAAADVVWPCDGQLLAQGTCDDGVVMQAKGIDYTIADLVADPELADQLAGGSFATIYLSPRDYHRVHTPVAGVLAGYRHVPGLLWPVSPRYVDRVPSLYAVNERAIAVLQTDAGPVAVVLVAATGVGNLWLRWAGATGVTTQHLRNAPGPTDLPTEAPMALAAGDELGAFHLGSTVIVIAAPGSFSLTGAVGAAVRCGEYAGDRTEPRAGVSS